MTERQTMIIKSLHMQRKKDPHATHLKWVSSACFTNDTSRVIVKQHESHLMFVEHRHK